MPQDYHTSFQKSVDNFEKAYTKQAKFWCGLQFPLKYLGHPGVFTKSSSLTSYCEPCDDLTFKDAEFACFADMSMCETYECLHEGMCIPGIDGPWCFCPVNRGGHFCDEGRNLL